jgi:acetoin utilization protein AcuC
VASSPFRLLWNDDLLSYDFGPSHPFQQRYRRLAVELHAHRTGRPSDRPESGGPLAPASRPELQRFHAATYLDRVERASVSERRGFLDRGDTPAFPGCYDAAARVVGATLEALRLFREEGVERVLQPSGGLHHAAPAAASGFCIFNDLAVAMARALDGPDPFARVAYVDIDAHHGDGVMYGFYRDGRVLDIDFHQDGRTLFPGTGAVDETGRGDGAGLKLNIPMPPGAGDGAFVTLFQRIVPTMLESHRPTLVVLQHGMDGHRGDLLAQLRLGPSSYRTAVVTLHTWASEHRVPLLVTGGGGYRPENVAEGLARAAALLEDPATEPAPGSPLPPSWRKAFQGSVGRAAPSLWEPDGAELAEGLPVWAQATLDALSMGLGRTF